MLHIPKMLVVVANLPILLLLDEAPKFNAPVVSSVPDVIPEATDNAPKMLVVTKF